MKRNKRVDAARNETTPVAATWTQTASGKIVPLVVTASGKIVPLAQNASGKIVPLVLTASGRIVPVVQNASGRIVPLAQTAAAAAAPLATQAASAVAPYAHTVTERVTPYAHTVAEKVGPYTAKAGERLAPLAASGASAAHDAVERVGPVLEDAYSKVGEAYGKVGPAFESAKDRVSDDLLPRVTTALGSAAGSPIAVEAVKRGRATVAAARGELTLPEPERTSGGWVKRVAIVAAVAGVVAVVARKLLGDSAQSGWQSARPSAPPSPTSTSPTSTSPTSTGPTSSTAVADDEAPADDTSADDTSADDIGTVGDELTADTVSGYGEGAYVGDEPPEGYVIKGNQNSMKYHLPDGSGYFSTKAEVWFNSEEAAKAAGFVPVQE